MQEAAAHTGELPSNEPFNTQEVTVSRSRYFSLLIAAALLLTLPLFAQDGSKDAVITAGEAAHDFITNPDTSAAVADNGTQVCVFCHIPHQFANDNRVLLWNHQFGSTTTYTPYTSASLDATVTQLDSSSATQLKSESFYSLACLSCHDGQTAINVVYRVPMGDVNEPASPGGGQIGATAFTIDSTNVAYIGTDLSNDHPVNFVYDSALATADGGLYDPANGQAAGASATSSSGAWAVRAYTRNADGSVPEPILYNGTVQCATCHNPHNETLDAFLRVDNATGSALCLQCHATT